MKIFSFIIIIVAFIACSHKKTHNDFANIDFQQGDVIFRKGTGIKSQAVLHADANGIYSHVGIVVLKDSTFQVVHIVPNEQENDEKIDKIKIEPIGEFWRKDRAKYGAVYRLKDNGLGEKAAQKALNFLQKNVNFDHDYNLNDTTEMYCTELVWNAYLQAGQDITCGKRNVLNGAVYSGTYIFPSDIYTNDILILIYKF